MQKKRAVGHSLMNALHFTTVQPAMQHVRQAYRATEFGEAAHDDGVRKSLPNEVMALVDYFREQIGTRARIRHVRAHAHAVRMPRARTRTCTRAHSMHSMHEAPRRHIARR